MFSFQELTLTKIERWIKETCSLEGVTDWEWDEETLTVFTGDEVEYYSYDVVYSEIAPMFIVVDTSQDYPRNVGLDSENSQSPLYHNLPSAIDKSIELNDDKNKPGVWEVFKLCPLSSEDIERWLPETITPIGYLN